MQTVRNIFSLLVLMMMLRYVAGAGNIAGRNIERRFDRFTFGIEGSFSGTFLTFRDYNFISSFGYRVHNKDLYASYHSNGELMLHAGCNVTGRLNLSLYSGCCGISRFERLYPVSLRITCYPGKGGTPEKWFLFAEGGPGMKEPFSWKSVSGIAKIGTGYSIWLSRASRLNFIMAFRSVFTKPALSEYGSLTAVSVSNDKIRKNNAVYMAMTLGIGLAF